MRTFNRGLLGLSVVIAGLLIPAGVAGATTPTAAETLATDVQGDAIAFYNGSVITLAAAILGVCLIGSLAVRWVKKYTSKSAA